jgi:hypothetical protein
LIATAFASGFGAGVVASEQPMGRFVYDHLVHPDRCPYMQIFLLVGTGKPRLLAPHRNS